MNLKQIAGEKAVDFVEDGMIVGLGTGSTADFAIRKIAERIREGLNVKGVITSEKTRILAQELKIPLVDIDEVEKIDLTIDGADEVDPLGNGIKGGGGALLLEKIVAYKSLRNIWVVEERKMVKQLGAFPLPVEIMAFGHRHLLKTLTAHEYQPELRKDEHGIFVTDGGHYLANLHLGKIDDAFILDTELKKFPGVLEHGLFLNTVNKVVFAGKGKAEVISFR